MKIKATSLLPYLNNFNFGHFEQETLEEFLSDLEKVSAIQTKDQYGSSLMGSLNLEILKKVHSLGGDVNDETNTKGLIMTVLSNALYWSVPEVVEYLLQQGADALKKSEYKYCAWDWAMDTISCSKEKNIKCLELLKKHSPIDFNQYLYQRDPNSKAYDLFQMAASSGNYNIALWLVENGLELNSQHKDFVKDQEYGVWEEEEDSHKKLLELLKNLDA